MTNTHKDKIYNVKVGDYVSFFSPGAGAVVGIVDDILPSQQDFPMRSRIFLDSDRNVLNPYPDAGTDVKILTEGPKPPPSPEDIAYQKKEDEAFEEFKAKPNGSGYMLYSHKSTGTVLIKVGEYEWLHYDYSGYGGYEAHVIGQDEAFFSYLWDEEEAEITADELEVSGLE